MTDREELGAGFAELHEADVEEYHALSGLAVAGLVLGVFSVVALVDPRGAVVSAAGAVASGLALWRIARRRPELIGRKAAVVGLFLSLLFGSIAVGHSVAYRWLLVRQSREIAEAWFDLVAAGQPQVAHQLFFPPDDRQGPGEDVWKFYCSDQKRYQALSQYLRERTVRTLVALGKEAVVRPYATESVDTRAGERLVIRLYSVTFEQEGRKTTFLVRVMARRLADDAAGRAAWQIVGVDGGVRPAWEGDEYWFSSK